MATVVQRLMSPVYDCTSEAALENSLDGAQRVMKLLCMLPKMAAICQYAFAKSIYMGDTDASADPAVVTNVPLVPGMLTQERLGI